MKNGSTVPGESVQTYCSVKVEVRGVTTPARRISEANGTLPSPNRYRQVSFKVTPTSNCVEVSPFSPSFVCA